MPIRNFDHPVKPTGEELDITDYTLVFEDEFNYDEFDSDVWEYRSSGARRGENIYDEYNTYGLKWTDDEYIFCINGVETRRSSFGNGISEVLEEVIVSLEIPEEEKLNDLDKDTYKTEFIVDYVRIYQQANTKKAQDFPRAFFNFMLLIYYFFSQL